MLEAFKARLGKNRRFRDKHSKSKFLGVIAQLDGNRERVVIQKVKEGENTNYSFSLDVICACDWLTRLGVSIVVKSEDGREHLWKTLRIRMEENPKRYQVLSL